MRNREAAVVTKDDLLTYFTGGRWKIIKEDDGKVEFHWNPVYVNVRPAGTQFFYRVEASDDPSDYEEGTSDDPVRDIAKFIGGGIPGGEFFEQMASSPRGVAYALRDLAHRVATRETGPKALVRSLRRLQMLPRIGAIREAVFRAAKIAEGRFQDEEIAALLKDMKDKGWQVSESKNPDTGLPTVELDMEYFTATIEVESILYEIDFQFENRKDLAKTQVTDDPIREFQAWYRSDEFKEADEERKADIEAAKGAIKSRQFEEQRTEQSPIPKDDSDEGPPSHDKGTIPSP